ncbi:tetratricopeptide repeat protein [Shewanella marina]|uniref:tetratricopeptide repeat protein n=1 Tax=Shewanella marina TaxID=487319 RepID=UPI000686D302|nr:tetratricopeptide repeat protein [Shewanella marina]
MLAHDPNSEQGIEQGIIFANKQLNNPRNKAYPDAMIDLALCRAAFLEHQGHVEAAMKGYDVAIAKAYQIDDLHLIADGRNIRGTLHSFQGDYALALNDLIAAQHIYDKLGLTRWANNNLFELATSYRRFGDPKMAIKYFNRLLPIYQKQKQETIVYTIKTEYALALEKLNKNDQALEYFHASYQHWQQRDPFTAATVAIYMAELELKMGRFTAAEHHLDFAHIYITDKYPMYFSELMLIKARLLHSKGDEQQAMELLERAIASYQSVKNGRGMTDALQLKSRIYAGLQQWHLAILLCSYI